MFIEPKWPAPSCIKAFTTLRLGGVSQKPFDSFNLAKHVGDTAAHVKANREHLQKKLCLPNEPIWLQQTHSTIALSATPNHREHEGDASFTHDMNQVCVVLTADCLPILLCNNEGTQVAAIHAGWRGLLNGIIESTLEAMGSPQNILVWLGPAIGPTHFEVGEEVREQFIAKDNEAAHAFIPSPNGRWLANIYKLARLRFKKKNINEIYGGNYCTYSDPLSFYSYRRDGARTGRQASLIWISSTPTVK